MTTKDNVIMRLTKVREGISDVPKRSKVREGISNIPPKSKMRKGYQMCLRDQR